MFFFFRSVPFCVLRIVYLYLTEYLGILISTLHLTHVALRHIITVTARALATSKTGTASPVSFTVRSHPWRRSRDV